MSINKIVASALVGAAIGFAGFVQADVAPVPDLDLTSWMTSGISEPCPEYHPAARAAAREYNRNVGMNCAPLIFM